MATNIFRTVSNGVGQIVRAIATSAGVADANKIVCTGATGKLDMSLMPAGLGTNTRSREATESLAAGDFVNEWNDAGVTKARKADAANNRPATGFVLSAFAASATAIVYPLGATNDQLSGLTVGTVYVLSNTTPGGSLAASAITYANGQERQEVGRAISAQGLDTYDNGSEIWNAA